MVIQHRSCTHGIPILEAFAHLPLRSLFVSPTHVLDVPIRETRSACHCLVRRALDLPQRIEHSPFSRSCEGETRLYWRKRKKTPALIQYARDTSEIFGVLCWLWCRSNSSGSVRACICSKKKGNGKDEGSVSHPLVPT